MIVWVPKSPCALGIGILAGSYSGPGTQALIDHGGGGCSDHVGW